MSHDDDYEPPLDCEGDDRDEHDPRPRTHRGSTNKMRDGRVSKFIAWGLGMLGLAFSTGVWIAANNLYQLNVTVVRGMDRDDARDVRLNDHEARLREVEHDTAALKGTTFRGVAGMDQKAGVRAVPDGK